MHGTGTEKEPKMCPWLSLGKASRERRRGQQFFLFILPYGAVREKKVSEHVTLIQEAKKESMILGRAPPG